MLLQKMEASRARSSLVHSTPVSPARKVSRELDANFKSRHMKSVLYDAKFTLDPLFHFSKPGRISD